MQETTNKVRQFINDNFLYGVDINSLENSTSLTQSGYVDSAGIMEVIDYVEDTFKIHVEDHELMPENFDSLDGISTFINNKLAKVSK